jgi:hypothetical protein
MMISDPDTVVDGQGLRGTPCPECGRSIEEYEVHYVYKSCGLPNHFQCKPDPDANRWVLHPCGHEMTREAWIR